MASESGYGPRHGIWILPVLMGAIVFIGLSVIGSLSAESTATTASALSTAVVTTSPLGSVPLGTVAPSTDRQGLQIAADEVIAVASLAMDSLTLRDSANAAPTIEALTGVKTQLPVKIGALNQVSAPGELGPVKAGLLDNAGNIAQAVDALINAVSAADEAAIAAETTALSGAVDAMNATLATLSET